MKSVFIEVKFKSGDVDGGRLCQEIQGLLIEAGYDDDIDGVVLAPQRPKPATVFSKATALLGRTL